MVKIEVKYEAGYRCVATHIPSGRELITDAPTDNHGKGESFSPTDLLATSMLTGGNFIVLGTDGFGRSDDRLELRKFFEVDTNSIVLATVSALEREGTLKEGFTTDIVEKFRISRERFDKTF